MKIGITGHTSGIGLSLFKKYKDLDFSVVGFSRSSGHDIGNKEVRNEILNQPFDLFINNAYHETGQNALLQELLKQHTHIIHISSNIVNMPAEQFSVEVQRYREVKIEGNRIIDSYTGDTKVLKVLPDLVCTNFFLGGDMLQYGMDPNYVADLIFHGPKEGELIIPHPNWSK
jgi:hypothetical protein